MWKSIIFGFVGSVLVSSAAMASCSTYPYTFSNGTTADATQVNADFACAALTSGASMNAVTLTGTTTLPGSGAISSTGAVGIGMTPVNVLDITQNQNGSSKAAILNNSSGSSSTAFFQASNGSAVANFGIFGSGYTSSGILAPNLAYLTASSTVAVFTSLSNPLLFGTNNTEVARFDTSGHLMVGLSTNEDSSSLQTFGSVSIGWGPGNVSGVTSYNGLHIAGRSDGAVDMAQVQFGDNETGSSRQFAIVNGRSAPGGLEFWVSSAVNTNPLASGSMAMMIASNSDIGIGTTSPSYTLHVNGSVAGTSAYVNLSDERLKKDIRPITAGLSIIEKLRGVRFSWRPIDERAVGKSLKLPVDQPQIGFVAQDLEKELPEAVSTAVGPDHIKSVAESKVVPVLVEAVKELRAANDNQAVELKQLRAELNKLETRVNIKTARN